MNEPPLSPWELALLNTISTENVTVVGVDVQFATCCSLCERGYITMEQLPIEVLGQIDCLCKLTQKGKIIHLLNML